METEEIVKTLETLSKKVDEFANAIKKEKKITIEDNEAIKEEAKIIGRLTDKINDLTLALKEKKIDYENQIKENPLAYIAGAFIGGILVGFLIGKGKEEK